MGFNGNTSTLILFSYLLFTSLLNTIVNATDPEVEDETSFSYVVGAPNGPQNWSNLNSSWILCGTGQSQSPINLPGDRAAVLPASRGSLTRNYKPAPATIRNRGHDIQVEWTGNAGGIVINGTEYKLDHCHWHIPSEHTVNGTRFAMELHIVHTSLNGDIAVIGVLYNFGLSDPFLARLSPYLRNVSHEEETQVGILNPWKINFDGSAYYRYNGSLTTPPCSENVTWTVIKKVKTVSRAQVTALQNAIHDGSVGNARPIQPLNWRTVILYRSRIF
ncbi:hypothetical protein ACJIZ3_005665 [Penstemon smallii]|uniref:Carbonic anhydrase n=1 Tax=Penstemon smallii TaxID=265156 RepID=A0ABD3S5S4_9LAMI